MRVLFDTNVLISAFISHGLCLDVMEYCAAEHQICVSVFILGEFKEKLQQKFGFSSQDIQMAVNFLQKISLIADYNENTVPTICRDKNDNHILAAAFSLKVDCIVTGDDDLLILKNYANIPILKPQDFWKQAGK